jgi:hypothetical protein
MNAKQFSTVQVLLEEGLDKTARKNPALPGNHRRRAFRTFSYTRKGSAVGRFKELSEADDSPSAAYTVTVFGFGKTGELARARKLVKEHSHPHHAMIAVASPAVFNNPVFRSILMGRHIEVLVEEHEKFQVEHLDPWIARLMESMPKRKPSTTKKPAPDPLNISKRLRDNASGRLDARKIVELFGISSAELATKVCGLKRQAIQQNPTSAGIQEKLQSLEEVAQLLHWCGGDDAKLRAWLRRPNRDFPAMNGKPPSPMDLILEGHAAIVANKVHNLLTGHPA